MGSKVKQTDPAQAAAANAGATGSANNATALSNTYGGQQQQIYNMLYGSGGTPGSPGTGGALTPMLDPKSLDVTKPTGTYALQNKGANEASAAQYAANSRNITSSAAQRGFGGSTPSGFTQSEQDKNARELANQVGQNFSTSTSNQYQDALKNFWNAVNTTSGQAATSQQGALQGNSTAAQTYQNLYGTAGGGHVVPGIGSSILAAAGTVGAAAACVGVNTIIRIGEGQQCPVSMLRRHQFVLGIEGRICLVAEPEFSDQPSVRIVLEDKANLSCSRTHTILRPGGGYVRAADAMGQMVLTEKGPRRVVNVEDVGITRVVLLRTDGSHTYLSDGIWSEE